LKTLPKILISIIICGILYGCEKGPSDSELISNFNSHIDAFSRLQRLATDDSRLTKVSSDPKTWQIANEMDVPNSKLKEYVDLLQRLSVNQKLSGVYGLGQISLVAYDAPGLIGSNYLKGYVLSPNDPIFMVDNLDRWTPNPDKPDQYIAFRQLAGNWYLFAIKQ